MGKAFTTTDYDAGTRRCNLCREVKHLKEFSRDRTQTGGLAHRCRPCDTKKVMASETKNRWWKNPQHHIRKALRYAVKTGLIQKPPRCTICGAFVPLESHHADYEWEYRLVVAWLCRSCHVGVHKMLKEREA